MENLTLKQLSEINNFFNKNSDEKEFEIGKNYFIRTVTYHYVGKVVKESSKFVSLTNCSLIADSGRFADAMKEGFDEVGSSEIEPYLEDTIVDLSISAITEKSLYTHKLPMKQK